MLRTATVTATTLNLRPTPSTRRAPIARLHRGTRLTIRGERGGWYDVESVGRRGWVSGRYVALDPVLMVDLYWGDLPTPPRWDRLAGTPGYVGAILKATQGTKYRKTSWFVANWPRARDAAAGRYGTSWFRGAYHYVVFDLAGAPQADFFLDTVERAGGWEDGDLHPIIDVERGKEGTAQHRATRQQVIDVVSAWIERVKARTGRKVILYGRGAMRDLGIASRMGADLLWNPSYTNPIRPTDRIGWPASKVPLLQYTDGRTNKTKYPTRVRGFGAVDASVFRAGHIDDLARTLVAR